MYGSSTLLNLSAYHETVPKYLCDLIIPYSNSCNLKCNNQLLLAPCQPVIIHEEVNGGVTKLQTYGERSFQCAAHNEWK